MCIIIAPFKCFWYSEIHPIFSGVIHRCIFPEPPPPSLNVILTPEDKDPTISNYPSTCLRGGERETTTRRKERWAELLLTLHCWCVKRKTSPKRDHMDSNPLKCAGLSCWYASFQHHLCNRSAKSLLCNPVVLFKLAFIDLSIIKHWHIITFSIDILS